MFNQEREWIYDALGRIISDANALKITGPDAVSATSE